MTIRINSYQDVCKRQLAFLKIGTSEHLRTIPSDPFNEFGYSGDTLTAKQIQAALIQLVPQYHPGVLLEQCKRFLLLNGFVISGDRVQGTQGLQGGYLKFIQSKIDECWNVMANRFESDGTAKESGNSKYLYPAQIISDEAIQKWSTENYGQYGLTIAQSATIARMTSWHDPGLVLPEQERSSIQNIVKAIQERYPDSEWLAEANEALAFKGLTRALIEHTPEEADQKYPLLKEQIQNQIIDGKPPSHLKLVDTLTKILLDSWININEPQITIGSLKSIKTSIGRNARQLILEKNPIPTLLNLLLVTGTLKKPKSEYILQDPNLLMRLALDYNREFSNIRELP